MPISSPDAEVRRHDPRYTPEVREALVEYVVTLADGDGPPIPELDLAAGDVAEGGTLYRLQCAACHAWSGDGGALLNREAPSLHPATPTQIAEAVRGGPGNMPRFGEAALTARPVAVARAIRPLPRRSRRPRRQSPLAPRTAGRRRRRGVHRARRDGPRDSLDRDSDMSDPPRTQSGMTIERVAFACFVVATLAALGLAGVYAAGGQPQAEGVLLGVALVELRGRVDPVGPRAHAEGAVRRGSPPARHDSGGTRGLRGRARARGNAHATPVAHRWDERRARRARRRVPVPHPIARTEPGFHARRARRGARARARSRTTAGPCAHPRCRSTAW